MTYGPSKCWATFCSTFFQCSPLGAPSCAAGNRSTSLLKGGCQPCRMLLRTLCGQQVNLDYQVFRGMVANHVGCSYGQYILHAGREQSLRRSNFFLGGLGVEAPQHNFVLGLGISRCLSFNIFVLALGMPKWISRGNRPPKKKLDIVWSSFHIRLNQTCHKISRLIFGTHYLPKEPSIHQEVLGNILFKLLPVFNLGVPSVFNAVGKKSSWFIKFFI